MEGITSTRLGDIYVRREADIVKVRERVRRLAREMGFDSTTQIKITTAVSELTRNIYEYARVGRHHARRRRRAAPRPTGLQITARDDGPGIDEAQAALHHPRHLPLDLGARRRPRRHAPADGRVRHPVEAGRGHARLGRQVAPARRGRGGRAARRLPARLRRQPRRTTRRSKSCRARTATSCRCSASSKRSASSWSASTRQLEESNRELNEANAQAARAVRR